MLKNKKIRLLTTICSLGLILASCEKQVSDADDNLTTSVAKTESPVTPIKKKVSRIVFVGQKQACECTLNRIDTSWKALALANSPSPQIPVERIDWDLQTKESEKYIHMKPMVVVPGIYFLDAEGNLIEMLQGEVSADKISDLL